MTVCTPVRRLYYKESTGYTVMIYETEEEIPTQAICDQEGIRNYFKAVGRQLPDTKELVVELDGKWISSDFPSAVMIQLPGTRRTSFSVCSWRSSAPSQKICPSE